MLVREQVFRHGALSPLCGLVAGLVGAVFGGFAVIINFGRQSESRKHRISPGISQRRTKNLRTDINSTKL